MVGAFTSESAQELRINPCWRVRKELLSAGGYDKPPSAWALKEAGFGQIELRPVDTVVQHALLAAWQKFLAFGFAQLKSRRDISFSKWNRGLALSGDLE
jgi:hypothetical protein